MFKIEDWVYCEVNGRGVIIDIDSGGILQVHFYSGAIERLYPDDVEAV